MATRAAADARQPDRVATAWPGLPRDWAGPVQTELVRTRYIDGMSVWAWWLRRMLPVLGILWSVVASAGRPQWTVRDAALWALTAAVLAGWLLWQFGGPDGWQVPTGVGAVIAGGIALSATLPHSAALALPAIGCLRAAWMLRLAHSIPILVATAVVYVLADGAFRGFSWWLLVGPASMAAGFMVGLIRRQNTLLAEETRLAREEQAHSAALDERARIAREIHDVLAHALAALTVQLETADALLEGGRGEQARVSVRRAGQLAREGLAETRRAIGALRGDTLPLPELLDNLATSYRTDLVAPAEVRLAGTARQLDVDTALALYRSAQEAVTNIRKHAPGAPLTLDLRYDPDAVMLSVVNGVPPAGVPRPLAEAGGGYGLTGLRERAELSGGTFRAGPADGGYRIDVTIPT